MMACEGAAALSIFLSAMMLRNGDCLSGDGYVDHTAEIMPQV